MNMITLTILSPIILLILKNTMFSSSIILMTFLLLLFSLQIYSPMPLHITMNKSFIMDLMSSNLIILTLYLLIMCFIISYPMNTSKKGPPFSSLMWTLCLSLVTCFAFKNIFWFYVSFEFALIPTILLIIGWGYQEERFQASFYLLMFTMTSSLPMLISLLMLNSNGSAFFMTYSLATNFATNVFSDTVWWLILITVFLVKLPLYLFHLWLPKAHVEAPVTGSMLLAGILLKLGGYGLLRFSFITASKMKLLSNPLMTLSLWGALIAAMICTTQIDLKSLIAYSSITHMGLMMAAALSFSSWGWQAALTIMISHGLCSSALFAISGMIYDFTNTRNMILNKGLLILVPQLMALMFVSAACNFGAPPSMNMMSELMAISSAVSFSYFSVPMLISMISLAGWYCIVLYSSISHGQLTPLFNPINIPSPRIFLVLSAHLIPLFTYLLKPQLILDWL